MLHPMTDADYAWMLGEADQCDGLSLCKGGIAPVEVTSMLRGISQGLASGVAHPVAWTIADNDEVIGMISFVARDEHGTHELGYGMAGAHQGRGIMTRAIGELVGLLRGHGLDRVTANTAIVNPASQRVLERNGFVQTGTKEDPEDGALLTWAIDLR